MGDRGMKIGRVQVRTTHSAFVDLEVKLRVA